MTVDPVSEFVPEWTDGDKLRKVRRHLKLTQAEFAEALQVTPEAYSAWESDRNRIPNAKAIAKRVKQMSGTPLWWWFDTERPDSWGPGGGDDGGSATDKPVGYLDPLRPPAPVIELRPTG